MLPTESILPNMRHLGVRHAGPETDWRARAERAEGLLALATRFTLGEAGPLRDRPVAVEARGDGRWAVVHDGAVLADDGEWECEPMSSSRDGEFLARTRYGLGEALRRGFLAEEERRRGIAERIAAHERRAAGRESGTGAGS